MEFAQFWFDPGFDELLALERRGYCVCVYPVSCQHPLKTTRVSDDTTECRARFLSDFSYSIRSIHSNAVYVVMGSWGK